MLYSFISFTNQKVVYFHTYAYHMAISINRNVIGHTILRPSFRCRILLNDFNRPYEPKLDCFSYLVRWDKVILRSLEFDSHELACFRPSKSFICCRSRREVRQRSKYVCQSVAASFLFVSILFYCSAGCSR